MSTRERCEVWTTRPPHYLRPERCTKTAKHERCGVKCCGTHARQADRWGLQMQVMVDNWWKKPS